MGFWNRKSKVAPFEMGEDLADFIDKYARSIRRDVLILAQGNGSEYSAAVIQRNMLASLYALAFCDSVEKEYYGELTGSVTFQFLHRLRQALRDAVPDDEWIDSSELFSEYVSVYSRKASASTNPILGLSSAFIEIVSGRSAEGAVESLGAVSLITRFLENFAKKAQSKEVA